MIGARRCLLSATSRRAIIATAAGLLMVPAAAEAQDQPIQMPNAPNCSVVCQRPLASELVGTSDQPYRAAQRILGQPDLNVEMANTLRGALERFEAEEQRAASDLSHTRQQRRWSERGISAVDDLTVVDVIPMSTFSTSVGHAFDDMEQRIESRREALSADVLGAAFDEMRTTHAQILAELPSLPWAEQHTILFGPDGAGGAFNNTDVFRRLPPDAKAELALLRVDLVRGQLQALSTRAIYNEGRVDALINDYTQFKSQVQQFAAETQLQIRGLAEGQRNLTQAYRRMSVYVADNAFRLDALEGVMFGTLTARQQIDALDSDAFKSVLRGRTPEEVAEFRSNLQFAAVLEDINDTAGAIGSVANSIGAIGRLVGADLSEPISRINQGVAIAQSLIGIASGNPLGIINGLGGLAGVFGPGSSDGTSAAIAALRQEIQQMRREMYEYHVAEMRALEALSRQVDQRFRELASLQAGTLDQVAFNTQQLDESLKAQLNACVLINDIWQLQAGETHDQRAARINLSHRNLFAGCRNGVQDRFYQVDPAGTAAISTIFSLQSLSDDPAREDANGVLGVLRYRNETLAPTAAYTLRMLPQRAGLQNCAPTELAFAALLRSPLRDGDLRMVADELRGSCMAGRTTLYRTSDGRRYDLERILANPISVTNVLVYGRAVYDAMAIYEFMDEPGGSDPRVMTIANIYGLPAGGPSRGDAAAGHLRKVLDVVNLSIAQLNLLGGDLILEVLARDIEAGLDDPARRALSEINASAWSNCNATTGGSAAYFNALCMLQRNDILRYNFTRHWIRTRLLRPTLDPARIYAVGMMTSSDSVTLASGFRRQMPIARCGDTWCLRLPGAEILDPTPSASGASGARDTRFDLAGDLDLRMPAWHEVATDRQAVATPQLDELLTLRRLLIDRIAEFRASPSLTPEQSQLVFASLIVNAAEQSVVPRD